MGEEGRKCVRVCAGAYGRERVREEQVRESWMKTRHMTYMYVLIYKYIYTYKHNKYVDICKYTYRCISTYTCIHLDAYLHKRIISHKNAVLSIDHLRTVR